MLVLARKRGQSIIIGDGIEVKILKVDGGYVSVGIEAPREISINRAELLDDFEPSGKEGSSKESSDTDAEEAIAEVSENTDTVEPVAL